MNWLICLLLVCATHGAWAAATNVDAVAALRAKYASLDLQLRQNQFKQPLVLDSAEVPNGLRGEIYAIVDYQFGEVSAALSNPEDWCEVLILHLNTKYCRAAAGLSVAMLKVNIGRKTPEELADTTRVEFKFSIDAAAPDYAEVVLNAKDGPMGTSDYRILLQMMALPDAKTFLHLTYSYATNLAARLAMQTYLGTAGRGKVGFSVSGTRADGQVEYIGGVRGLVERNTMRYYLAIDSFLGAVGMAPAAQLEHRLQSWFTATERYPRQLHEIERREYLEMKRAEYLRQQAVH